MAESTPESRTTQSSLMLLMLLAFIAGVAGAGYAWYHVETGLGQAEAFGLELPAFALFYAGVVAWAIWVPMMLYTIALVLTEAGKVRRKAGVAIAMLLFAFSVLWPAGAFVAYMDAYDPPRTNRAN